MFLSIIVPVYNAQRYVGACLDSLLQQDIPAGEYEIICVNDGSRDDSGNILQQYQEKFANVRVLEQANAGVAAARNAGLGMARGMYIWFVDADDLVMPNVLGALRQAVQEGAWDRVVFGAYQFSGELTPQERERGQQGQLPANAPWYDAVVWRGLLRRDFLKMHQLFFRYPHITHGEDGLFLYQLVKCSPKTRQLDRTVYYYRVHSQSAETAMGLDQRIKRMRSHMEAAKVLREFYDAGEKDALTADKMMLFLWSTLYDLARLSPSQRREPMARMKQLGLFPCCRPRVCSITNSYMTDRQDLVGKGFDWLYRHQHTRWGFALMALLCHLRGTRG